MRQILAILVVALMFSQSAAFAETKEIISEGAYNMGDGETPTVAESRALLQAKRTAVEEAGTYVESYSKTKNFQLTADEIQVLASGVMEVEVLEKKRTVVGDGFNFWVKIKAQVSTDKMEEMAKRVKEKSVVEDYKRIQEAYDKSQKDIEELKRQLAGAKGEKERKQVEARITDEERLLRANEWFDKGYQHSLANEHDDEIESYTKAIALNPNIVQAYYNRGIAYDDKGQYDRAIEDYNKAIALNPIFAYAYVNRGIAYGMKGQYDKAIEDFNKAIALDPNDAKAYYNRGRAYGMKGQYDRAIEDYNKAIALDPNFADAYVGRGLAYNDKRQYDRAIEDYNKAIALDPHANAYYNRGNAYADKGQYDRAIEDYNKAIVLKPELC
ncbi:MAG: tetratricopeptide repeat protein [Deltaproteobacteria bacterium]